MPEQNKLLSDNLEAKLPRQSWVLRYSGLFIIGLIFLLLMSLYWIQLPVFVYIELHPTATANQFKATTEATNDWIHHRETISLKLENGNTVTFNVESIEAGANQLQLYLTANNLRTSDQIFLQQEYISIGKLEKENKPLIWSLFSN